MNIPVELYRHTLARAANRAATAWERNLVADMSRTGWCRLTPKQESRLLKIAGTEAFDWTETLRCMGQIPAHEEALRRLGGEPEMPMDAHIYLDPRTGKPCKDKHTTVQYERGVSFHSSETA